ncbi:hypothetical protein LAG90_15790 [Marinilongibacter aquaticus]|uniref:hypothetical protein n=1 Tax=Marinilongibacter aquaticus TaxID=2975157 RepID=UPI0021BD990B|nr:hypothetical protein [Marinilongibacter aquaticus]UBM58266.1 hypothetical protein LAG90_15790 [Marinilongibacter aquaticus]
MKCQCFQQVKSQLESGEMKIKDYDVESAEMPLAFTYEDGFDVRPFYVVELKLKNRKTPKKTEIMMAYCPVCGKYLGSTNKPEQS